MDMPDTRTTLSSPASAASLPSLAREKPFAVLLLITGIIGWLAAAALVLERLALYRDPDRVTSCDLNPWVSCGKVMQTWQSELFGFPNPLIGLVAFTVVITTGMAILSGARLHRWYWGSLQVGVTLGTIFVIWLWSQALFEIYILCLYCIIVWAAMIPLFILLTIRNMIHGIIPAPPALIRWCTAWAGTLIASTYIAVGASIFFRFIHVFTG